MPEVDYGRLDEIIEGLGFSLTKGQDKFLRGFIGGTGHSFLLGDQGTGKSTIMSVLKQYYGDEIVFLGATGIASTNMPDNIGDGTAFRGFGLPAEISNSQNMKNVSDTARNLMVTSDVVKIVVIDEAFGLDSDNLWVVKRRVERYNRKTQKRKRRDIRVLLVGDCLQRPPIVEPVRRRILKERYGHHLMFLSSVWGEMDFTGYVLTENKRQNTATQEDRYFAQALQVLRYGMVDRYPKLLAWLNKRVNPNYDRRTALLSPTNARVSEHNNVYLQGFDCQKYKYSMECVGDFKVGDCPVDMDVVVCEGAKILTVVNHKEGDYVNGDMFIVKSCHPEGVLARNIKTDVDVLISPHQFQTDETYIKLNVEQEDGTLKDEPHKRILGTAEQIPIKLCAGFTIARCQGVTLDADGVIDVGDDYLYRLDGFMVSGLFVALSRFRSINQITLARKLEPRHIKVCRDSIDFWYKTLAKCGGG